MPLKPAEILKQLQDKREQFTDSNRETLKQIQLYRSALETLCKLRPKQLQQKIDQLPPLSGAIPLESLSDTQQGVVNYELSWGSREESLVWVRDRISGVSTFAVDGSQIFPSKDFSLLVALVQVGWFENLHTPDGSYSKDIEVEVLTPKDLAVGDRRELIDREVNMKRFQMETDRLIRYMEEHDHCDTCLVFFDGSLIATFAEAFEASVRQFYVKCLLNLLQASQTYQVPLVGYIDTSYARDLTTMVEHLAALPESDSIHDAQLMNGFMKGKWGDRTPLYLCDRAGILKDYLNHADQITFTYLKTTHDGYPARLEFPRWIYDAGRLEQVIDWVRSEVIIGGGYPYVIETADQTAVLQGQDRQIFYRILQDWAAKEDLTLRLSRKMVSKARRR